MKVRSDISWQELSSGCGANQSCHELKSWPEFFGAVVEGRKTHELRRNDRGFRVGDVLVLREFEPTVSRYTGRVVRAVVTYITEKNIPCAESQRALDSEYAILSIRVVHDHATGGG